VTEKKIVTTGQMVKVDVMPEKGTSLSGAAALQKD
jgi:hypothetical protein